MPYVIPHVFKAGEKAIAEQVNANFNYLKQSLEQLSTTLGSQISASEDLLGDDIEELQTQLQNISTLIQNRDTILNLGSIVTPDPLPDGQIPTADINLNADRIQRAAILANAQIVFPTLDDDEIFTNTMLEFTLSENCSLALPGTVTYSGEEPPEIAADGVTVNRLIFDTTTGGDNWCCYYSSLSTSQNSSDESETEAV